MCAERGPVCLGDRASPPHVRPSTDRALTVTRIPPVVESKCGSTERNLLGVAPVTQRRRRLSRAISTMAGVSVLYLLRQADQVSDGHECAYANESRQADGEEYPQKLDLLGFEIDDPHCSSARQLLCPATQRDIAVERKAVSSLASAPWLIFLWRGL